MNGYGYDSVLAKIEAGATVSNGRTPQAASGFPNLPRVDPQKAFATAGSNVTGANRQPAPRKPEVRSSPRPVLGAELSPLNVSRTSANPGGVDDALPAPKATPFTVAQLNPVGRQNPQNGYRAQQANNDGLTRYNTGTMAAAQKSELGKINRETQSTLRENRVMGEADEDGIIKPARDESGQVKFTEGKSPQLNIDEQLHRAAHDALGVDIYRSAEKLKGERANLVQLKKRRGEIPLNEINSVAGTRAEADALDKAIEELENGKLNEETGLTDDPPEKVAIRAHKELTADREAWGSVKPTTPGQLDQLLDERRAKILERGGNPDEDRIIQTIAARKQELGIGERIPESEKALRKDPAYAPILARRDTLDEEIKPVEAVTNRLIARLENISGVDTGLTSSQQATLKERGVTPFLAPKQSGGDPFARVAAALSYVEQLDPAKRSQAEAVLRAMEPYLGQLRQMKTHREGLQAQVEHRVRETSPLQQDTERKAYIEKVEASTAVALGESPPSAERRSEIARMEARTAAALGESPPTSVGPEAKSESGPGAQQSTYTKDALEKVGTWKDENLIPPKPIGGASQFARGTAKSFLRTLGGALAGFGQTELAREEKQESERIKAVEQADQPPAADAKRPGGRLPIFESEAAARAAGKQDNDIVLIRQKGGTNKLLPQRLGSTPKTPKIVPDLPEDEAAVSIAAGGQVALAGAVKSTGEAIRTDPTRTVHSGWATCQMRWVALELLSESVPRLGRRARR